MKHTYLDSSKKKAVRDFLIDQFTFNEVIGLPGPDINEYVQYFQNKGIQSFEMYERDKLTLIQQIRKLRTSSKLCIKHTDILDADPFKENVLYDLDFCASVKYLKEHIAKFKHNFIMTFSMRVGVDYTIKTFFKARKEKVVNSQEIDGPVKHTVFKTDKGKYLFIRYFDTSAMCCFAKIA